MIRSEWIAIGFLCITAALGCGKGATAGRDSLHELEHVIPEHWPSDPGDAASKLRERMSQLEPSANEQLKITKREILDLVQWAPEICADTDIEETTWVPIYEASEEIGKQLLRDETAADEIETLCRLLDEVQRTVDAQEIEAGKEAEDELGNVDAGNPEIANEEQP